MARSAERRKPTPYERAAAAGARDASAAGYHRADAGRIGHILAGYHVRADEPPNSTRLMALHQRMADLGKRARTLEAGRYLGLKDPA